MPLLENLVIIWIWILYFGVYSCLLFSGISGLYALLHWLGRFRMEMSPGWNWFILDWFSASGWAWFDGRDCSVCWFSWKQLYSLRYAVNNSFGFGFRFRFWFRFGLWFRYSSCLCSPLCSGPPLHLHTDGLTRRRLYAFYRCSADADAARVCVWVRSVCVLVCVLVQHNGDRELGRGGSSAVDYYSRWFGFVFEFARRLLLLQFVYFSRKLIFWCDQDLIYTAMVPVPVPTQFCYCWFLLFLAVHMLQSAFEFAFSLIYFSFRPVSSQPRTLTHTHTQTQSHAPTQHGQDTHSGIGEIEFELFS